MRRRVVYPLRMFVTRATDVCANCGRHSAVKRLTGLVRSIRCHVVMHNAAAVIHACLVVALSFRREGNNYYVDWHGMLLTKCDGTAEIGLLALQKYLCIYNCANIQSITVLGRFSNV